MSDSRMRVAIVHERFTEYAGSEAVVEQLAREWLDAEILAPISRAGVLPSDLEPRLRSTVLSKALRGNGYAHLLPALPIAMRRLHLPASDVVVASHHAFATQVVHATSAPVVAYVHSPARWAWDPTMRVGEAGAGAGAAVLAAFSAVFRPMDRRAAAQVHSLVANSRAVSERIRQWWQRESVVVHPPVHTEFYTVDPTVRREDFFLLAGRLVPYKRPDLAVQAASLAGVPLIVAGDGRARADVERVAGPDVRFVGRVDDETLRDLYRRCGALLMPGIEDFGIVPVEAQACGAPVIALDAGGAQDSVVPTLSGELVPGSEAADEVALWADRLIAFKPAAYDSAAIRRHAERFGRARFRSAMSELVRAAAS